MNIDIIEYSKKAHEAAKAKGWWDEVKPMETYLMLIISELAECMEADRKGKRANVEYFTKRMAEIEASVSDDRTHENYLNTVFERLFKSHIKDSVEDELADAAVRILDLLGFVCLQENDTEEAFRHIEYRFNEVKRSTNIHEIYSLPESLFLIVCAIKDAELWRLCRVLWLIFTLASQNNVDLLWHIDQKMKYNKTRPHKHGNKAY